MISFRRLFVAPVALVALVALTGCSSLGGSLLGGDDPAGGGSGGATDANGASSAPSGPACTELGRSYPDMVPGQTLESDRVDAPPGFDRARMKPYETLRAELARVLGGSPPAMRGDAFGEESSNATPPPHLADGTPRTTTWYDEPRASSLTLYVTSAAAFDACTSYAANDPATASAAPTPDTARAACAQMAHTFWSRTASPAELDGCVAAATTGATDETDPHRKWAWGCVSLLASADFLTY